MSRMMHPDDREAVRQRWRDDDGTDLAARLERAAYALWFIPDSEFDDVIELRALMLGAAETIEKMEVARDA